VYSKQHTGVSFLKVDVDQNDEAAAKAVRELTMPMTLLVIPDEGAPSALRGHPALCRGSFS
jgi:hypothetical protein